MRLLAFAGGIAAAFLVRNGMLCTIARRPGAAIVVIGCLFLVVALFPTAYAPLPIVLLSMAFAIVACGITLFGVLNSSFSRMLGDMSYSIYLLHGILLFSTFRLIIGENRAASLSTTQHCIVAMLCTPVLVIASFITYRLIELPWMHRVSKVTSWLHRKRPLWLSITHIFGAE
jgi:peptidoglycan/LPS O-acetylase OafA/YrhL